MGSLAKTMGLVFENNDVQVKLSYPYFAGTALMQVRACASAARIFYVIERGTLAIWQKDKGRAGEIPLISPETGMVGYPSLSSSGMTLKTLFNRTIRVGGDIRVESAAPVSSTPMMRGRFRGKFRVGPISHSLSCEVPGGPWFTTLECYFVSE